MKLNYVVTFAATLFAVIASYCPATADSPAPAPATTPTNVGVNDPGWTWSGMSEYDDPEIPSGQGRAGGPGTSGTYSFTGTAVSIFVLRCPVVAVGGRQHRTGSLRISIDGRPQHVISVSSSDSECNVDACDVTELANTLHVLQLEPVDGWAIVCGIKIGGQSDTTPTQKLVGASIPDGEYRIFPTSAPTQTLDVVDRATTDGTLLQIWVQTTTYQQENQWFHITQTGPGLYSIHPLNAPTEAISVFRTPGAPQATTGIWNDVSNPAQTWIMAVVAPATYRLSPEIDQNLALTVSGGMMANGTKVICKPWADGSDQQWQIAAASH